MRRPSPPLNVLIVEDEAVLVMDMECMVEDAGHRVIGDVASLQELSTLHPEIIPDLALVDIQLAERPDGLEASRLIKLRWPGVGIVFVTANPSKVPLGHVGSYGIIAKPFARHAMIAALAYLSQGMCDPPPQNEVPAGFVEFPEFSQSWLGPDVTTSRTLGDKSNN